MVPKLVIVGRPNVGKSSLFNLLLGRRVSIVDATPGVTRDRVSAYFELPAEPSAADGDGAAPLCAELIDTGGHGIDDAQNLTAEVERQIARGLDEASLVLFVIDAQAGVLPLDEQMARLLRKFNSGKEAATPVLVVANKVDGPSQESLAHEAYRLGFGEPVIVSATTSHHKRQLIETLARRLAQVAGAGRERAPDAGVLLAIVGKRNAGKSTLVNALAGEQRVIVSEIEGTTRDAVDVRLIVDGHAFTAIDTAGVRKRKSIDGDVEYYSHHRALRSIRRADVVLLLIDSTVPTSQVDRQLAQEIQKHYKPCVVVVNKWDLAADHSTQEAYVDYLDKALMGLSYAPIAFISAKRGEGMRQLLAMALNLDQQSGHRVPTAELNRIMEALLAEHRPASKVGKRARIYYVTQLDVRPPTLGLFVNDPDLFDPTYQRFLLNRFRDELPFSEVAIKLVIRGRRHAPAGASIGPDAP